ncbi:hypothetical protein AOQ84DRAFT_373359 [Glonium stellatum]|uniref:Uncharacterized protein n=1 Tax=Glonium stellatum TaxID=574774 RepID=A0A8E2JWJ8_9PEZI|nr:hypothetical protein AOQ84DRAFT_373359 [Glonium stellatum]
MSGGGNGYYRHPCIYRYQYNCPNWVWQNGDACGTCLAAGRPSKRETGQKIQLFPEVGVPLVEAGQIRYVTITRDALGQHLVDPSTYPLSQLPRLESHGQITSSKIAKHGQRSWYCL